MVLNGLRQNISFIQKKTIVLSYKYKPVRIDDYRKPHNFFYNLFRKKD